MWLLHIGRIQCHIDHHCNRSKGGGTSAGISLGGAFFYMVNPGGNDTADDQEAR